MIAPRNEFLPDLSEVAMRPGMADEGLFLRQLSLTALGLTPAASLEPFATKVGLHSDTTDGGTLRIRLATLQSEELEQTLHSLPKLDCE